MKNYYRVITDGKRMFTFLFLAIPFIGISQIGRGTSQRSTGDSSQFRFNGSVLVRNNMLCNPRILVNESRVSLRSLESEEILVNRTGGAGIRSFNLDGNYGTNSRVAYSMTTDTAAFGTKQGVEIVDVRSGRKIDTYKTSNPFATFGFLSKARLIIIDDSYPNIHISYYHIGTRKVEQKRPLSIKVYGEIVFSVSKDEKYLGLYYREADIAKRHALDEEQKWFCEIYDLFTESSVFRTRVQGPVESNGSFVTLIDKQNTAPRFSNHSRYAVFYKDAQSIGRFEFSSRKERTIACAANIITYGFDTKDSLVVLQGNLTNLASIQLRRYESTQRVPYDNALNVHFNVSLSPSGEHFVIDLGNEIKTFRTSDMADLPGMQKNQYFQPMKLEFINPTTLLIENSAGQQYINDLSLYFLPRLLQIKKTSNWRVIKNRNGNKLCLNRLDSVVIFDLISNKKQQPFRLSKLRVNASLGSSTANFIYDDSLKLLYKYNRQNLAVFDAVTGDLVCQLRTNAKGKELDDNFPFSRDDSKRICALGNLMDVILLPGSTKFLLLSSRGIVKYNLANRGIEDVVDFGRDVASSHNSQGMEINALSRGQLLAGRNIRDWFAQIKNDSLEIRSIANLSLIRKVYANGLRPGKVKLSWDGNFAASLSGRDSTGEQSLLLVNLNSPETDLQIPVGIGNSFDFLDANHVWITDGSDKIKIYDLDARLCFTAWVGGTGAVIVSIPEGYFLCDKSSLERISYVQNDSYYSGYQVDLFRNRPDLVLKKWYHRPNVTTEAYGYLVNLRFKHSQVDSSMRKLASPPVATILNKNSYPESTEERTNSFTVRAEDAAGIDSLYVYCNGRLIQKLPGKRGKVLRSEIKIDLAEGNNKISVFALNVESVRSIADEVYVKLIPKLSVKPRCYLVCIGVKTYKNPSFKEVSTAETDVDSLMAFFSNQTHLYSRIDTLVLKSKRFDHNSILRIRDFLKDVAIDDRVIVYYEGHGLWGESNLKYYLTTSTSVPGVDSTLISIDKIKSVLEKTACRNTLVLLNSCRAGERDSNQAAFEVTRLIFDDERVSSGINIVATSYPQTPASFFVNQKNTMLVAGIMSLKAKRDKATRLVDFLQNVVDYMNRENLSLGNGTGLNVIQLNYDNNYRLW